MQTNAVVMAGPGDLGIESVALIPPTASDIVIDVQHSGISTGTERLLFSGDMPTFPGMGYPLVPGYEAAGEVVSAGSDSGFRVGEYVFAPGSTAFDGVRGLFGGASARLVTASTRVQRIDRSLGSASALLALAATARHAISGLHATMPDLIVGHGVLGRLLARLTLAAGAAPPVVWETDPARRSGSDGYEVLDPEDDPRRDYTAIFDASGRADLLDDLVVRIARGGEIVLAGFYSDRLSFSYPPAFMKEARLRVAAEWTPSDLVAVRALLEGGALSLDGLITHTRPAADAGAAYREAFDNPACLKMILNWEGHHVT